MDDLRRRERRQLGIAAYDRCKHQVDGAPGSDPRACETSGRQILNSRVVRHHRCDDFVTAGHGRDERSHQRGVYELICADHEHRARPTGSPGR